MRLSAAQRLITLPSNSTLDRRSSGCKLYFLKLYEHQSSLLGTLFSRSFARSTVKSVKFCIITHPNNMMKEISKYQKLDSEDIATPDIEKNYVHQVYDAIAPHFSATRFAKWPKVACFLNSLSPGSVVLDAGCGNGKYLGFNPNCFYIGCDISPSLINICAKKGHEVLVGDAVNLPYRTSSIDAAISIAVLHHLSTEYRRKKAIEELIRVVRKGGNVLITVWAVEQEDGSLLSKWTPLSEKYNESWENPGSSSQVVSSPAPLLEQIPEEGRKGDSMRSHKANQEYFIPWHLPYHRAEVSGTSEAAIARGFAKKDDKKGVVVYNRYYHVFAEGELQRLVAGIDNTAIVAEFFDKSNWCIVLQKR